MIKLYDGKVEIHSTDEFWLNLDGRGNETLWDREDLTYLRAIIDQALNTSAEELEASGE